MLSRSFTSTYVQPSWFAGVRSYEKWISRSVHSRQSATSKRMLTWSKGIIMFLQSLPTQDWGDHEIELLLSEAFVLNSIWHNAQSHFNGK